MGKITKALQKAAEERLERFDKITQIRSGNKIIIKKVGDSKIDPRLIAFFDPKALISEQYKILRTNLQSLNKKNTLRSIIITSALPSEGKTITALNLACTLAQSTQQPKVLYIDGDLRRGRSAQYLGISKDHPGFSELLEDKTVLSDAMFSLEQENLNFIVNGEVPRNPSELLQSERMKEILTDLKHKFDFIIIDMPPIISVTDAGAVSPQTDGALLVIQAGRTQRGIVRRAQELLHQAQCPIIGHVLTGIEYHLPEYIYRYL